MSTHTSACTHAHVSAQVSRQRSVYTSLYSPDGHETGPRVLRQKRPHRILRYTERYRSADAVGSDGHAPPNARVRGLAGLAHLARAGAVQEEDGRPWRWIVLHGRSDEHGHSAELQGLGLHNVPCPHQPVCDLHLRAGACTGNYSPYPSSISRDTRSAPAAAGAGRDIVDRSVSRIRPIGNSAV